MQSETINNQTAFIWPVAAHLRNYVAAFSDSARDIMDKFNFDVRTHLHHTAIDTTSASRMHNLNGHHS